MPENISKIYSLMKDRFLEFLPKDYCFFENDLKRVKFFDFSGNKELQIEALCKIKNLLIMFSRIGLIKNTIESCTNRNRIKKIIDNVVLKSNDDFSTVIKIFLSFCCGNDEHKNKGVCGTIARCEVCNITHFCSYWHKRPSIKQLPEVERPRERLIHQGEEQLSDAELLGIILKDGTPKASAVDVARTLLSKYGNFRELGNKTISELCKIDGIGEAKAAQIKATIEIAKRYSTITLEPGVKFKNSDSIFKHFHEKLRDKKQETFLVVLLDNKNRVLKEKQISIGSLTASIVHPREVFGAAIKEHAASVVFVHNHPSGDPYPSSEDIEITKRLDNVSKIVGIKILDHIIIGNSEYFSLKDKGIF